MTAGKPAAHRRGAAVEAGILDATAALLGERGFAISVEEVAERAGVHRSNIYRRWETKPQLVAAAVRRLAAATVVVEATGDAVADLQDAAVQVARSLRAGPGRNLLRAALAACASDPEMAEVVRDFFAARYAIVVPVIQQGVADRTLRADVDPALLWQAVANPMHLDAVCGIETSDERARALVDLMLAGARGR
jgi:AcrR family transcriptional regulator